MAPHRLLLAAIALLLGASAINGMQFSGATFTGTSTAPTVVSAADDWTLPTVTMTDPGSPLSGTVTVAATAADARSSVASVAIQYAPIGSSNWTTICTDDVAAYSCSWVTTTVADGSYRLRAIATDTVGLSATSAEVSTAVVNNATVTLGDIGSPVRGSVPLTVTVTGSGGASVTTRVEYRVSGTTNWTTIPGCGTSTGTSRTCTWATSGAESYDVRAVAVVGGTTKYDQQDDIQVDNVVPTLTLTVPTGTLRGGVDLTAVAGDVDSGVDVVTFQYKTAAASTWTTCGIDSDAPYACHLVTSTWPNGSYHFRAIATDLAGNTTTTASAIRTVDNTTASVSVTSPTAGSTVGGTVVLTADAFASQGINSVRFEARATGTTTWTTICSDAGAPFTCSYNSVGVPSGNYDVRAVLTPTTGATVTSATVTFEVENVPLTALDVQAINAGTLGRVDANDKIVLTYSTLVNLATIKAGWTGASTPATVTMKDRNVGGTGTGLDRMETNVNLGYVTFAQDYVKTNRTTALSGSTMTAATVTVGGEQVTAVTITFGTPVASDFSPTSNTSGAMRWTPSTAAYTPTGIACSATAAAESGASDRDL